MNKIQPAYWFSLAIFGLMACSIFVARRPQILEFVIPLVGFVGFFVIASAIRGMMKGEKDAPEQSEEEKSDSTIE